MSEQQSNIQGEPLELSVLLAFAEIDASDIQEAIEWWDAYAAPDWVGVLDSEPIE